MLTLVVRGTAVGEAPTLIQWLRKNGAEDYLPQFQDGGFEEFADLEFLDPDDLDSGSFEAMPPQVRKRVTDALQNLKRRGMPPPPKPPPIRGSIRDNFAPASEVDVDTLDAILQEAATIHADGDLKKAAAKMLHVIYLDPNNPIWRINLGAIYETEWKMTGEERLRASAIVMYQEALDRGAGEDNEEE